MKVKELIEKLKEFDGELEVVTYSDYDECGNGTIDDVRALNEYDANYNDSECKVKFVSLGMVKYNKHLSAVVTQMENTTKLWKVVVEISYARSDGNGECSRDTKTRYFDDFESAEHFADRGDIRPHDFFAQVVSRHIYEYNIRSVRELEHKKRETVREVKDIAWVWE